MSHLQSIPLELSLVLQQGETPFERAFLNNLGSPLLAEQAEVAKAGTGEAATTTNTMRRDPRSDQQQRAEAEGTERDWLWEGSQEKAGS